MNYSFNDNGSDGSVAAFGYYGQLANFKIFSTRRYTSLQDNDFFASYDISNFKTMTFSLTIFQDNDFFTDDISRQ